jgi:translocating chain-associated membrane protein 1
MVSHVVFVLARLGSIMLSVLTFWYGLALSDKQGLDVATGNFNTPSIRLGALAAVCALQGYLMFNFITDQLQKLREQAPATFHKISAKKPLKKKADSKFIICFKIVFKKNPL